MKKIVFVVLLFVANSTIAQNTWSVWQEAPCYKGLDFRVKKGSYNEHTQGHKWLVQIRNRYKKTIDVSVLLYNNSSSKRQSYDRLTNINTNNQKGTWFLLKGTSNASHLGINLRGLKVKGDSDFYKCDK